MPLAARPRMTAWHADRMLGRLHHVVLDCPDPAGHPFCLTTLIPEI